MRVDKYSDFLFYCFNLHRKFCLAVGRTEMGISAQHVQVFILNITIDQVPGPPAGARRTLCRRTETRQLSDPVFLPFVSADQVDAAEFRVSSLASPWAFGWNHCPQRNFKLQINGFHERRALLKGERVRADGPKLLRFDPEAPLGWLCHCPCSSIVCRCQ